jgi:hypothetical protein
MKNIAAKFAFEDGCDYIAWHDVDMLPYTKHLETLPDYSYPEETPTHIATRLSKYAYGIGYDQYFGGVVLFTKEQVERTNGYSNEYWDWGQEDDDLFWRCHLEGYSTHRTIESYDNRKYVEFNGENSEMSLTSDRSMSSTLNGSHTVSILYYAEQQHDKVPIWLVGDNERKFIEYPIIRKGWGYTWGLSFNNSRAVTFMCLDRDGNFKYSWVKRYEKMWSRAVVSYDKETGNLYFFNNDVLENNEDGFRSNEPINIGTNLKPLDSVRPFYLGHCPNQNTFFKGKIAEVKIYDQYVTDVKDLDDDKLITHYDFNQSFDELVNGYTPIMGNVTIGEEDIKVIDNIIPHRREGSFYCLPHVDEGFVNGVWAKGETTAKNERRYVTKMQQGEIDYKNDGMNTLKFELVNVENFTDNCLMYNVKL